MTDFFNAVGSVVWGAPMLIFFITVALMFSYKSRFFQIRGFGTWFSSTVGALFQKSDSNNNGISQFGAFCSVLASCIGTGNIVGVATAIYSGGAGAVFWMWVSAVFSMMTAYAENFLGISYKLRNKYGKVCGGAFSYIERGVKMKGLAKVYAVFCLFSTLGMGNMAQSNSIAVSIKSGFGVSEYITAAASTLLCFIIIAGGIKRLSKASEFIVPVMTVAYLGFSIAVLIIYKERILTCISEIFKEAFTIKAASGFGLYKAMRYGISRGVFSNEAGLGSSTIIHSETENKSPQNQGMWAMFEVFCDTVFLCTIMALVILVSGAFSPGGNLYGAEISLKAYSALGELGTKGIASLTAVFAFASLAGCSFHGEKSAEYLFTGRAVKPYRAIYLILSFFGAVLSAEVIWAVADIFNGLMAVPNLFAIAALRKEVIYPEKVYKN